MADKAIQASANPTVKLTAATWATLLLGVSGLVVRNLAPGWYDADVWMAAMPFAVLGAGYFVHDSPNVVVVQQQ